MKDGSCESVAELGKRRIRGIAAQTVLVAFMIAAANMRKIATFL